MSTLASTPLATVGQPLFGSLPLALATLLGAIALFTWGVALLGRWLAATHPEAPPPVAPHASAVPVAELTPEELSVIAAAVHAVAGPEAQIVGIKPAQVSVEALMQQWSLEGRRQIYSSHKLR